MRTDLLVWGRRLKTAVEFLSALAVIVGIYIYFGFEREDARRNARIEHVLQYIEQFQENELLRSRNALSRSWFDHRDELRELTGGGAAPADVIQRWARLIVEDSPRDGSPADLQAAIFTITEYFDQLGLCVEKRICEASTAKEYFGPYAERFYCLYKPVIEEFRDELALAGFGKGLVALAPAEMTCMIGRQAAAAEGQG